ncbi:acyl-CoA thioesterase [Staphylococcus saprophyticus]|uniref:acyl-CoA thioesterase n=1 Tax=Staphylococcus saprophyticus TaxID=29385 RepID=UPI00159F24D1|nr:thioesterase family protein [Staphylococcus saprophyticus]MCE5129909.1 acyl-CoA thioesterase [Staphylococcus saprophyticus]WMM16784.1 thioesterase family protein [Staphylococcus saprophyticus]
MMTERKLVAERNFEVNGYDIDAMGIVSNIVYIRWFEDLRTDFINQYMPYSNMMNQQISPILMNTEAEYKTPITIHDKPVGRCYLVKASKLRWEFEFEIESEDAVHCIGKQSGTFFDLQKKKVTRLPEVFQTILS